MSRRGPFTKTINLGSDPSGAVQFHQYRNWYRNGLDRETPNPYTSERMVVLSHYPDYFSQGAQNTGAAYAVQTGNPSADRTANNNAYAKFRDSISANASLGATLAEWKQASGMILQRVSQLSDAYRALKRGRFGDLQALFGRGVTRVKPRGRTLADLWLELHFGWEPLVKDIGAAALVLNRDPPSAISRGKGRCVDEKHVIGGNFAWTTHLAYESRVLMQARVRVENPNLHLLDQLGFINPLSVMWEVVPFSFVVDWFVPVGAFLSSFTDFVGLEMDQYFTTTTKRAVSSERYNQAPYAPYIETGSAFRSVRTLSIPAYQFGMTHLRGLSTARGATAIALLIQQLGEAPSRRY